MDSRNGLVVLGVLVLLFVFTFVFAIDALAKESVLYGILALIGFIVCFIGSLFMGSVSRNNGDAIGAWLGSYTIIISVIFVWFATRCGTAFKWW